MFIFYLRLKTKIREKFTGKFLMKLNEDLSLYYSPELSFFTVLYCNLLFQYIDKIQI